MWENVSDIFLQIVNLSIQSNKRKISCLEANLNVTDKQTGVKIFTGFFVRIKPRSHLMSAFSVASYLTFAFDGKDQRKTQTLRVNKALSVIC